MSVWAGLDQGAPVRLSTLVVGVDASFESLYALELGAAIGGPHEATIRVAHVHPRPGPLSASLKAAAEYERAQGEIDEAVTRQATKRLDEYPGRWTFVARHGHIGHELLAEAAEFDADLLVIGHRSHGTVHDALLGSVAASAVHHSRRSVLVAIPPSARS